MLPPTDRWNRPGARERRGCEGVRASSLVPPVTLLLFLAVVPAPAQAQDADGIRRSAWSAVIGERTHRRRLTAAIWAMHPYDPQFPELDWTGGLAFSWSQWFLASFVNSYDERSFMAGIERTWAQGVVGYLELGVGYRAGVVTGYDERLLSLAGHTPVLPFAGVLVWGDLGPAAVDLYYVYRAITLETSIRL